MPVLGHAFTGWAIGIVLTPSRAMPSTSGRPVSRSEWWVPISIGLSYFPDISAQLLQTAGWHDARIATHSFLFSLLASPILSLALSRVVSVPFTRLLFLSLISIFAHDLLDLAQYTDRVPWWPFSDRAIRIASPLLPIDPWKEALFFGVPFIVILAFRYLPSRGKKPFAAETANATRDKISVWASRIVIAFIMLAVGMTHYLRDVREQQLENARSLAAQGEYAGVFHALDLAERWPSCAKPGRIDYLRAEAYLGIGDRPRAETLYLRSFRQDPTYIWVVADLAKYYASSEVAVGERRRLAAPYLARLRRDFPIHPELPRILASIERSLSKPSSSGRISP